MSTNNNLMFVRKAEKIANRALKEYYNNLNLLYWQIEILNKNMNVYNNKRAIHQNYVVKFAHIDDIKETISRIYKEINYYKECINIEKREMSRIYDKYGYAYSDNYEYDMYDEYEQYCNKLEINREINTDSLEEIKEYKYNFATGVFD